MIYSLVRIGNWPDSDIARVYRLSESDVRSVFSHYVELRRMSLVHSSHRWNAPRKRPVNVVTMPDIQHQQNVRPHTVPD